MKRQSAGICLIAFASLVLELSLIRAFDVLFYPNIAYMIVTSALFALGLGGVYTVFRPPVAGTSIDSRLAGLAALFAVATLSVMPVANALPFDFNKLGEEPAWQLVYFALIYLALGLPFFLVGMFFSTLFSAYARRIQALYFWDLVGAALGSLAMVPFIRWIGPGGMMIAAGGVGLVAAALLVRRPLWRYGALAAGLMLIAAPFLYAPQYFDFVEHQDKRGIKTARENNQVVRTIWDPVSKIDLVDYGWMTFIAYDGGSQNSTFYPFDGNWQRLRANIGEELANHFWQRGVLASHYLKRDTGTEVLVIGSAGGQEVKAALLYGAAAVDGIEMVEAVVELGKGPYAEYIGSLYQDPRVNIQVGEGRSFLRSTDKQYDIIQIFSNHTSSSIASGTGAMATTYLQTAEAYREYFGRLTPAGILHINHHDYPRMITTAALAWAQMGRDDFKRHVVVFQRYEHDTLPTLLISMQPWTEAQVAELEQFYLAEFPGEEDQYQLVEHPLSADKSLLADEFYHSPLPQQFIDSVDYRVTPATDDRPYFNFARKSFNPLAATNRPIDGAVANIPLDIAPIWITGAVSLFYAILFAAVPLQFSKVGRTPWRHKGVSLLYFTCLGAGFIIIELVYIQKFMRLLGSPLYTYSLVIAVMLLGAGIGSYASQKLGISPRRRWYWPFAGVLAYGLLLLALHGAIFEWTLTAPFGGRALVACLLLLPMGFFLGMPFPLGILTLADKPPGAVAWAWGMNGLFTVIGGLLAVIVSVEWGFTITLLFAFALYLIALLLMGRMRTST